MLAPNYMTAEELEIDEATHRGLVIVLGMLERGELKHAPEAWRVAPPKTPIRGFNMGTTGYDPGYTVISDGPAKSCGSVACIGGWVCIVNGWRIPDGFELDEQCPSSALRRLYFPCAVKDWDDITPTEAAAALRNYLVTGDPAWDKVVPAERLADQEPVA